MKLIFLLLAVLLKVLMDKGFMLTLIMLFFVLKNASFHQDSARLNDYLTSFSLRKLQCFILSAYICAAVPSSVLVYVFLTYQDFVYALPVAVILFVVCLVLSLWRFLRKGREFLIQKLQELAPQGTVPKKKYRK